VGWASMRGSVMRSYPRVECSSRVGADQLSIGSFAPRHVMMATMAIRTARRVLVIGASVIMTAVVAVNLVVIAFPTGCRSRCSAPYELLVAFRYGTTHLTAVGALTKCSHDPVVSGIGKVRTESGAVLGTLWTRKDTRSPVTQPLLDCLRIQPSFAFAAWPASGGLFDPAQQTTRGR
jgi:hypothetical protein